MNTERAFIIEQDEFDYSLWSLCQSHPEIRAEELRDYILGIVFIRYISSITTMPSLASHSELQALANSIELPKEASFDYIYTNRNRQNNHKRLVIAYNLIEEAIPPIRGALSYLIDSRAIGDINNVLADIIQAISEFELELIRPELSTTFQYFLELFDKAYIRKGDTATPPKALCDLVIELMSVTPAHTIYDPACGTGGFLISAQDTIAKDALHPAFLFGEERNSINGAYTKLTLLLLGVIDPEISKSHCLTNPVFMAGDSHQQQFNIVVSMPPFAMGNWGYDDAKHDPFNRFKRGLPPKSSGDYAYISHMLASARENTGLMAVVLPQGVLYRGAREAEIRQAFIKDNLLDAVIVLPEKLLINTNIPLAVLIFNKGKEDNDVLFIDASQDFEAGKITNTLLPEHTSKIIQTYKKRECVDKYATLATLANIQDNNYNCNIPRYVDSSEEEKPVELGQLNSERKNLLKELAEVGTTIAQYIGKLESIG